MIATERVHVGSTDIRVSRLGIGGGSQSNESGPAALEAMLEGCWHAGLRYFDTAPLYVGGESERRIGAFLSHKEPADFVLSSKVGRLPAGPGERRFDYSAAGTRASIDQSLDRLGLDRLDIAVIHDVDREMHGDEFDARYAQAIGECFPVLAELRDAGTIGAIGLSSRQSDVCLNAAQDAAFDCFMMAGSYTLLNHGPLSELLPFCEANAISVLLASPYNSGILATGSASSTFEYQPPGEEVVKKVSAMMELCARYGVALATAALQFPLFHPAITAVVVGHRNSDEVIHNVQGMKEMIPAAFWHEMKTMGLLPADAPTD